MSNTITDLRKHLFDSIAGLKEGTMEIDKAKTIADLCQVVINSAKVEVDFMRMRGDNAKGTGFIQEEKQIEGPAEPVAKLVKR